MKKSNKKGFTIVELVIVIAVIAILASVLIPTFASIVEKATKSAVQQEAANIYKELYALDLSDGKLDKKDGDDALTIAEGCTYVVETNGSVTFSYTKDDYTATFQNGAWTVADAEDVESE